VVPLHPPAAVAVDAILAGNAVEFGLDPSAIGDSLIATGGEASAPLNVVMADMIRIGGVGTGRKALPNIPGHFRLTLRPRLLGKFERAGVAQERFPLSRLPRNVRFDRVR